MRDTNNHPLEAFGPRTVGKSTLLGELARSRGVEVVDLDEPATRAAVLADPGDLGEPLEGVQAA